MAEEPPYLQVGTEVSAKYRGAFCEATIKAVKILVKCRVNYGKGNLATVNNESIKGSLKPGSQVQAKHSDGTYHPASIIRVSDASIYTVVFDDGDEVTLRRSSLCLQGARHFKESQTLDQLPLTDPENFGTPVMLATKRRRRHISESSGDESDDTNPPKRPNVERLFPVGSVAFLEKERRRSSWLPVIVVPSDGVIEESDPSVNLICVRSFKDGRFFTADPADLHEFAEDKEPLISILRGDITNTHKQALEKAMAYLSTQELPWDMDLSKKKLQSQQASKKSSPDTSPKSISALSPVKPAQADESQLSSAAGSPSLSLEQDEEQDTFLTDLKQFHLERGTPMTRPPVLSQKTLDLYRLYQLVQENGGMEKVTQEMKWKQLYNQLGLSSQITSASYSLKMAYKKYLYPYEMRSHVPSSSTLEKKASDELVPSAVESQRSQSLSAEQHDSDESGSVSSKSSSLVAMEIQDGGDSLQSVSTPPSSLSITPAEGIDGSSNVTGSDSRKSPVATSPPPYSVGDLVKVWFGKGKFLKTYTAKVVDYSVDEGGQREYYVHYSGWNTRYDEWVEEERVQSKVVEGTNEKTRPSFAKKKTQQRKGRGRPPQQLGSPDPSSPAPPTASQSQAKLTSRQKTNMLPPNGSPAAKPVASAVLELSKLATSTAGTNSSTTSSTGGSRGPGRPKKKRLPSYQASSSVVSPESTSTAVTPSARATTSTITSPVPSNTNQTVTDPVASSTAGKMDSPTPPNTTSPDSVLPADVKGNISMDADTNLAKEESDSVAKGQVLQPSPLSLTTNDGPAPVSLPSSRDATPPLPTAQSPPISPVEIKKEAVCEPSVLASAPNDVASPKSLTSPKALSSPKALTSPVVLASPVGSPSTTDTASIPEKELVCKEVSPLSPPKIAAALLPGSNVEFNKRAIVECPVQEDAVKPKVASSPDVSSKKKKSLVERRREQASDWIVDFSKMPELDSAGRISLLTEKIGAIQKRYAELKAEMAYLDRKKRRAKQREREALRNNQSPVVECSS